MIQRSTLASKGQSPPGTATRRDGRRPVETATAAPRTARKRENPARNRGRDRRIVIRPFFGPQEGLDVTDILIEAVAHELGQRFGGNKMLNHLEAERLLLDAL